MRDTLKIFNRTVKEGLNRLDLFDDQVKRCTADDGLAPLYRHDNLAGNKRNPSISHRLGRPARLHKLTQLTDGKRWQLIRGEPAHCRAFCF
jgi:hypothetical protein